MSGERTAEADAESAVETTTDVEDADPEAETERTVFRLRSRHTGGRMTVLQDGDGEEAETTLLAPTDDVAHLSSAVGLDPEAIDHVVLTDHETDGDVVEDVAGVFEGAVGEVDPEDRPTLYVPVRSIDPSQQEALKYGAGDDLDVDWVETGTAPGDAENPERVALGDSSFRLDLVGFTDDPDRSDAVWLLTDEAEEFYGVFTGDTRVDETFEKIGGEVEADGEAEAAEAGVLSRVRDLFSADDDPDRRPTDEALVAGTDGDAEPRPPRPAAETIAEGKDILREKIELLVGDSLDDLAAREGTIVLVEQLTGDDGTFTRILRGTPADEVDATAYDPADGASEAALVDAETGDRAFDGLSTDEVGVVELGADEVDRDVVPADAVDVTDGVDLDDHRTGRTARGAWEQDPPDRTAGVGEMDAETALDASGSTTDEESLVDALAERSADGEDRLVDRMEPSRDDDASEDRGPTPGI